MTAFEIVELAYREFDEWVAEHDPDGVMDVLEQIDAYYLSCND